MPTNHTYYIITLRRAPHTLTCIASGRHTPHCAARAACLTIAQDRRQSLYGAPGVPAGYVSV